MPIRSFLKSSGAATLLTGTPFAGYVVCCRYWGNNQRTVKRLGTEAGGKYVDGLHHAYEGGQIKSLLSLVSYLGSGEYREKFHGVKIPPTNLPSGFEESAAEFARGLVASVKAPAA